MFVAEEEMNTKPKTKEPQTDDEFVDALKALGYELIDHDVDSFSVQNKKTGSQTHLEAEDYSSALFEAWNLMKK